MKMDCKNNDNGKILMESICNNCIKRLLTLTQNCQKIYMNENKNIYNNNYGDDGEKCGICFGILGNYISNSFLDKIKNYVIINGYEYDDFQISVSIPTLCMLREYYFRKQCLMNQTIKNMINANFNDIKEEWKKLCLQNIEILMNKRYNQKSSFTIQISFIIDETEPPYKNDMIFLSKIENSCGNKMKNNELLTTKQNIQDVISKLNLEEMNSHYFLPLSKSLCKYKLQLISEKLYFAGRYLKFSRSLPQTAWIVEGKKKSLSSIEEILKIYMKKKINCSNVILISSGREDVDVRCLGKGRPFILEIQNPKRDKYANQDIRIFQREINESTKDIEIKDFQIIKKEETKYIKEGEDTKSKTYSALCFCYQKLNKNDLDKFNCLSKLTIFQKTPTRVLHRRSLMIRERIIKSIETEYLDENHFRINLTTQAGTYVKEFINGDLGRTKPSLFDIIGKKCDILELDVMAVNLDFPPEINLDE